MYSEYFILSRQVQAILGWDGICWTFFLVRISMQLAVWLRRWSCWPWLSLPANFRRHWKRNALPLHGKIFETHIFCLPYFFLSFHSLPFVADFMLRLRPWYLTATPEFCSLGTRTQESSKGFAAYGFCGSSPSFPTWGAKRTLLGVLCRLWQRACPRFYAWCCPTLQN